MDMDHLIGQRFNLISKSEIRCVGPGRAPRPRANLVARSYVGTLHEINPEQSTIALENVFSFGTEDRKAEKFIPPSQQKYGFIIFRGSDVKDIKIAEDEQPQMSPPPNMPNDPAILVCWPPFLLHPSLSSSFNDEISDVSQTCSEAQAMWIFPLPSF